MYKTKLLLNSYSVLDIAQPDELVVDLYWLVGSPPEIQFKITYNRDLHRCGVRVKVWKVGDESNYLLNKNLAVKKVISGGDLVSGTASGKFLGNLWGFCGKLTESLWGDYG